MAKELYVQFCLRQDPKQWAWLAWMPSLLYLPRQGGEFLGPLTAEHNSTPPPRKPGQSTRETALQPLKSAKSVTLRICRAQLVTLSDRGIWCAVLPDSASWPASHTSWEGCFTAPRLQSKFKAWPRTKSSFQACSTRKTNQNITKLRNSTYSPAYNGKETENWANMTPSRESSNASITDPKEMEISELCAKISE